MISKIYFFILALVLLLAACTKDDPVSAGGHRLTKTIWRYQDSIGYYFYYYDDQNRLARIEQTLSADTNHFKQFASFIYDADGQLVKSIYTNDFDNISGQDSFWYDNKYLVRKTSTSSKTMYLYDGQERLVNDTIDVDGNGSFLLFYNYTYDADDNITSWQENLELDGTIKSSGTITASYNNSINPYFELGLPIYIVTHDNTMLSKHLRTQVVYYNGTTENLTYEYYPDGTVKKLTSTLNYPGGNIASRTAEFFYE